MANVEVTFRLNVGSGHHKAPMKASKAKLFTLGVASHNAYGAPPFVSESVSMVFSAMQRRPSGV